MALWDGRFTGGPAEEMQRFGESLSVDLLMWEEDIWGSKAHSHMLCEVGLLTKEEMTKIHEGLDQVSEELRKGWQPSIDNEDIHMAVEGRLHEIIGPVLEHTARSRNDQVIQMYDCGFEHRFLYCVLDTTTDRSFDCAF